MYRIEFLPSAARELQKLPIAIQRRVGHAIDGWATDPRPPGVHKLAEADDMWRLRVGDYRILYQVGDMTLVVLIIKVGHRGEVYR